MSGAGWTDIVGAVGGIIGVGLGGTSAVIAGFAKRDSRESAKAARDSADEAAEVRRIEADRQHTDLMPRLPATVDAQLREGTLWGSITVPKLDYLVKAVGIYSAGGERLLEISYLLRADQPHEFPIEPWPHGMTEPKTREIRFSFWPPTDDAWHCRCGRPEREEANQNGHWQRVVPVAYYDVTQSVW